MKIPRVMRADVLDTRVVFEFSDGPNAVLPSKAIWELATEVGAFVPESPDGDEMVPIELHD